MDHPGTALDLRRMFPSGYAAAREAKCIVAGNLCTIRRIGKLLKALRICLCNPRPNLNTIQQHLTFGRVYRFENAQ
jgi:hypothetical protein